MRVITRKAGIRSVTAEELETLEKIRKSVLTPQPEVVSAAVAELPFEKDVPSDEKARP